MPSSLAVFEICCDGLPPALAVSDVVLISIFEDKVPLVIATHKELDQIDARDVMNYLVNLLGGSGGGRSDFAQGGIEKVEDIEIALASLSEFLVSLNS